MEKVYKSHFGPQMIEPKKYLAELMCVRDAKKNGTELVYGFWNLDKWKRIYQTHLFAANTILKVYRHEAVVAALRKCPGCNSLRAKWFHDTVKQCEKEINLKEESIKAASEKQEEVKEIIIEKPRESFDSKKSVFDRLKDL